MKNNNKQINNKYISNEKIYYHIPDQYINVIRNNNINIINDHGHYYCIMTMRQLYQIFNNSSRILIKYFCEQCNSLHITNCQNITRKMQKQNGHLYCPKCSMHKSLYKYSNKVPISKQQQYFYNLFNSVAKINYQVGKLFIDIAIPQLNIGIEYNGGGHDFGLKINTMTYSQFIKREWSRRYILLNNNWKIIYIVTPHDKINIYTNEEYIRIFNYAYLLLQDENIVEIYLEDNRILTYTKMAYINDILEYKEKNMQIFSINQTIKYLHISRKTLYHLYDNKILLINSTPYNFKYYTQDQLDEYISLNGKLNKNNFFLKKEAAAYVNVSPYKFDILRITKELFPQIISQDEYYSKQQLNECIMNKIFDKYLSTSEALNYLNTTLNTNKQSMPYKLIPLYTINQLNFYTKEQLDKYISKKLYLNNLYTRKQAAKYLHLSLATLDRLKQQNLLIPIENNYLYSKEQLDNYLISNDRNIDFDNYITVNDAANIYSLTKKQIWNLIYSDKIKSKFINNLHYILKQDLNMYLENIHKFDNEYISAVEIRKLFLLNAELIGSLRRNKKVRSIKQGTKYLYNKKDILVYIDRRDNYINIRQCCEYLNITKNTLSKIVNTKILVSDQGKYSFVKVQELKNSMDNIFIPIAKVFMKKIDIQRFLINNKFYVYKKELFDYLYRHNIKIISLQEIDTNKIDIYISLLNRYKVKYIIYQKQHYILYDDYLRLKKKLYSILINQFDKLIKKKNIKEIIKKANADLINIKNSAKYLNISESKAHYLMKTNKLKYIILKRKYYTKLQWLEEYKNQYCNVNRLLTFIEAYQYLNISHNTLEKIIRKNELSVTIIDKKRYFKLDELKKLKDKREISLDLLDINQAAQYLNLPTYTVNKYAKQNKIKYILKGVSKHYYFKKEYLDEYLEQCRLSNNLFTLDQTVEYLNTSKSSLQRWEETRKLVPIKIHSKPYYSKQQLDEFKYNQLNKKT